MDPSFKEKKTQIGQRRKSEFKSGTDLKLEDDQQIQSHLHKAGSSCNNEMAKQTGSVIKRQFRQCLTKPCSKPFSILPTVTSKHCLLLMVTRRLVSQPRKLFIYLK